MFLFLPFRGSSVVEQVAVNHLVVGSNPAPGAPSKKPHKYAVFCYNISSKIYYYFKLDLT